MAQVEWVVQVQQSYSSTSDLIFGPSITYTEVFRHGAADLLPVGSMYTFTSFCLFLSFPFNLLWLFEDTFEEQCEKLLQVYLQWGTISQKSKRGKDQEGQQPELRPAHPAAWSHICCWCRLLLCSALLLHTKSPPVLAQNVWLAF